MATTVFNSYPLIKSGSSRYPPDTDVISKQAKENPSNTPRHKAVSNELLSVKQQQQHQQIPVSANRVEQNGAPKLLPAAAAAAATNSSSKDRQETSGRAVVTTSNTMSNASFNRDRLGQWPSASDSEIAGSIAGFDRLRSGKFNKGLSFSIEERQVLGIHGLLPAAVRTEEKQLEHCLALLEHYTEPLDKYIYLMGLADT